MRIKILSDSTCDLSQQILEKYNIDLIPLTIIKDGKDYQDNVTITPVEIFAHVASGGELCSTTAVSIGEYEDFFAPYAAEYDGVIHINLGSGFSSTHQNACLAAEKYDNVRVVDSQNLSSGQGLVALEAARLAETATDLDDLKRQLDAFTAKVDASFLIDKLNYLVKGGRCSSAAALGANLLNLKPCIEVRNGKMIVGKKYRGAFIKSLPAYVKDRLEGHDDLDPTHVFITETKVADQEHAAVKEAVNTYGSFDTVYETTAGCTISCHCGPGTLGILYVHK